MVTDFARYEAAVQLAEPNPPSPDNRDVGLGVMGLCGETGELADIFKKHLYFGHELDIDHVIEELGDTLWYLSYLARCVGSDLAAVAAWNAAKLARRYPDGFSTEASIARADKMPPPQGTGTEEGK